MVVELRYSISAEPRSRAGIASQNAPFYAFSQRGGRQ